MFAHLAPKLRDNGWKSVIPVANPGKRPLESGWNYYNKFAPSDADIDRWAARYPNAGVGLAYGPDGVLGVDLDFVVPETAAHATSLTYATLGITDCVRVGCPPKSLLLYRASPNLRALKKAYGGFELFSSAGQTVLYGTHPNTGNQYYWPSCAPEDAAPEHLPLVHQAALDRLISLLEPLCPRIVPKDGNRVDHFTNAGRVTQWLHAFAGGNAKPLELCRVAVEAAPEGDRYPTAFSAVVALVHIGLTDAEIITSVIGPYLERFDGRHQRDRRSAILSGLRWARREIGPDAATIAAEINSERMFAGWHARWRHGHDRGL
jgi:hypothetical protein